MGKKARSKEKHEWRTCAVLRRRNEALRRIGLQIGIGDLFFKRHALPQSLPAAVANKIVSQSSDHNLGSTVSLAAPRTVDLAAAVSTIGKISSIFSATR